MLKLNKEQERKYNAALEDEVASLTDDPYVNYLVDCTLDDEVFDDDFGYNEEEYLEEIQVWKNSGGFLIT
jgi:hypothetical protein